MYMYRTDDTLKDFERYDSDMEDELKNLPECCCCGEPIQQETAVCINDEWFCDHCIDDYFRKRVRDYVG